MKTGGQGECQPALAKFQKVNQFELSCSEGSKKLGDVDIPIWFGYWTTVTRIQGQSTLEWLNMLKESPDCLK